MIVCSAGTVDDEFQCFGCQQRTNLHEHWTCQECNRITRNYCFNCCPKNGGNSIICIMAYFKIICKSSVRLLSKINIDVCFSTAPVCYINGHSMTVCSAWTEFHSEFHDDFVCIGCGQRTNLLDHWTCQTCNLEHATANLCFKCCPKNEGN